MTQSYTKVRLGGCREAKVDYSLGDLECCASCHEEWEAEDMVSSEFYPDGASKGAHYVVCCTIQAALWGHQIAATKGT